jgi:MoaA/NifB/PqqE/SkfB family radical SAM enzyme
MGEIRQLTTYLYDRCPRMEHHNLAIIRGDRKNPSLQGPSLREYQDLYAYLSRLWAPRESGRYGGLVEPMLQWTKVRTAETQAQVVPCRAGTLSAVVYANGDVSVCETHPVLGNLRQRSFWDIWSSEAAQRLRQAIARKQCYCTNEIFMWPSIVYQPVELAKVMVASRAWRQAPHLPLEERVPVPPDASPAPAAS